MKKFLSALLACLLAFGLAMFVGCSKEGTISGNYSEVTEEDWTAISEALDAQTMFGDMEQEDWNFGFEAKAGFEFSAVNGNEKISADGDAEYKFGMNAETISGAGSVKFSFTAPEGESTSDINLEGSVYNDAQYFYFGGSVKTPDEEKAAESKIKFDISSLFGGLTGGTATFAAEGSLGTETAPSAEIAAILQQAAAELSLKVEADLSSGTKLKISATEETFDAVLAEILGGSTAESAPATFTSNVLEVYLYIDKDGTFAQAAANIDIAGAIEIPASDTEEAQTIEFSVKGTASIKISADIPELPDDLDSYREQA